MLEHCDDESIKVRVLAKPASEAGGVNPYARLLYTRMRALGVEVDEFTPWRAMVRSYDVLHIHWPEYYVAHRNPLKAVIGSALLLCLVSWCRSRGMKVIWTVHNLGSHNSTRPHSEQLFWKLFTRRLDGYVSLNRAGEELIPRRFPSMASLPHAVIPHGHYREAYPVGTERAEARRRLRIPQQKRVFLFFGSIARYKGVSRLVEAFRALTDSDSLLYIVGPIVQKEIEHRLREESKEETRIHLCLSRLPVDEVGLYFSASNLVVLPFSDIFNSGSAMLALSFDRPLLVPAMGAMPELQETVGGEWVCLYEGTLTPRHLEQAMDWALRNNRGERAPLDPFNWDQLAASTLSFYSAIERGEPVNSSGPAELAGIPEQVSSQAKLRMGPSAREGN